MLMLPCFVSCSVPQLVREASLHWPKRVLPPRVPGELHGARQQHGVRGLPQLLLRGRVPAHLSPQHLQVRGLALCHQGVLLQGPRHGRQRVREVCDSQRRVHGRVSLGLHPQREPKVTRFLPGCALGVCHSLFRGSLGWKLFGVEGESQWGIAWIPDRSCLQPFHDEPTWWVCVVLCSVSGLWCFRRAGGGHAVQNRESNKQKWSPRTQWCPRLELADDHYHTEQTIGVTLPCILFALCVPAF